MTFRKILVCVVGMVLISCPVLFAASDDSGHGRWWQNPAMAEKIGLKLSEKQALDNLFMQNRKTFFELRSEVEKEKIGLDNILEQPRLDERAAAEQFKKLEQKRQKLSYERFRYLLEVRKILGNERYQKLTAMAKERHAKRLSAGGDEFSTR